MFFNFFTQFQFQNKQSNIIYFKKLIQTANFEDIRCYFDDPQGNQQNKQIRQVHLILFFDKKIYYKQFKLIQQEYSSAP
ncbi:unnamed protein product [Paramecium octaurelia]|uniref:Uncharacterized protein n=1 Tax=Paramecium octaurelia TaxID=43137 RepID=A0A8S1T9F9_PAROT|nr:unnamed protein product [Paramecium octaurelia]